MNQFPPPRNYASLSVSDLIDGRDAYHLHLAHLTNVTATAIGRYRIHEDDWYATHPPTQPRPKGKVTPTGPKTLYNTVVKPWSWPCVLVFVDTWIDRSAFAKSPDQMVPRALFLPDGRVIPTCVIEVQRQDAPAASDDAPSFPNSLVGGGFLLTSSVQGQDHFGSVGCLVSDGRKTYALTNQHVAGRPGEEVATILRGTRTRIGVGADIALRKMPFEQAYPGWTSARALSNLDVGMIDIDDLSLWTTQIAGIGAIGLPLDLNADNITVDLIDAEMKAFGGASGPLAGKVIGLFYRYKSIGGTDYIADLLIAPVKGQTTRPGDSGTLWCMVDPNNREGAPRPTALQWGGHVFVEAGTQQVAQGVALATLVSTVCREADLDVVRGLNSGLPEYWGDVGHYTIGAKACQLLGSGNLSKLMTANIGRVAYSDDVIAKKSFKAVGDAHFWPLADVPDKVWKVIGNSARRIFENPNHFADMDHPDSNKQTLLDLTAGPTGATDPKKVTVEAFEAYYTDIHDRSRGLLPFRVWQLYDLMVASATAKDPVGFVAAAGIMAHYVGDSCQPLHISYKFNGDPDRQDPETGKKYGDGVHEAYESLMLKAHAPEMLAKLNASLGIKPGGSATHGFTTFCKSGHDAAVATVDLMREAFKTISPDSIIDTYVKDKKQLWPLYGMQTVDLLAEGSKTLAMIWESAWKQAGGKISKFGEVDIDDLMKLIEDPYWAPSVRLNDVADVLAGKKPTPEQIGLGPKKTPLPASARSQRRHTEKTV